MLPPHRSDTGPLRHPTPEKVSTSPPSKALSPRYRVIIQPSDSTGRWQLASSAFLQAHARPVGGPGCLPPPPAGRALATLAACPVAAKGRRRPLPPARAARQQVINAHAGGVPAAWPCP